MSLPKQRSGMASQHLQQVGRPGCAASTSVKVVGNGQRLPIASGSPSPPTEALWASLGLPLPFPTWVDVGCGHVAHWGVRIAELNAICLILGLQIAVLAAAHGDRRWQEWQQKREGQRHCCSCRPASWAAVHPAIGTAWTFWVALPGLGSPHACTTWLQGLPPPPQAQSQALRVPLGNERLPARLRPAPCTESATRAGEDEPWLQTHASKLTRDQLSHLD